MSKEPALTIPASQALARRSRSSLPEITLMRNASEAALAVAAAFAAMFAVAASALYLLGAGSLTSVGPATAAVVSLAVGGSLRVGTSGSSGGLLSIGVDGSLRVMPLGVTLAGTVALGLAFYLPLRRWQRLTPGLLAGRIAAAAGTCCLALVVVAAAGHGTLHLPSSLTGRLGSGLGGAPGLGGLGSALGRILFGSGGAGSLSDVPFLVSSAATVLGGLMWLLVVLLAGLAVTRAAWLPAAVARSRLRMAVGPALSASIRVVLVLVLVFLAFGTGVGLVLGGGNGPKVAGGVLLLLPSLLFAVLSAGVGVPWSLSAGPAASAGTGTGGPGGILGILGRIGGAGGGMNGQIKPVDRALSLSALFTGGSPLWIPLLLGSVAVLLACGVLAAARTPLRTRRDGTPAETPGQRARRQAAQLGAVWAVGLSVLVLCAGLSGKAELSIMGTPMTSFGAHVGANAVLAFVVGVVGGGAGGGAGSLLLDTVWRGRARRVFPPDRGRALARLVRSRQGAG